jgi:hypothetical protein
METSMGDGSTTGEDRRFDRAIPADLMLLGWHLGQLPLMLYTAWWNEAMKAFWPYPPHCHHVPHHEEHEQLVVPEPIEEEGEHALIGRRGHELSPLGRTPASQGAAR